MKNTPRLNLKNFSNEFNLLLDIIRLENVDDIELGIEQIINTYTRVNWNEFMELVLHHRVFPVVVPKMLLFQKNGFFPGFVGELLNSHY
ncbi:hypothetical protein LCD38_10150, partial [Bacillus sp. RAR_GA_16]|nr:hypothetical protein [Bacillus sp. RAR_GA_16]